MAVPYIRKIYGFWNKIVYTVYCICQHRRILPAVEGQKINNTLEYRYDRRSYRSSTGSGDVNRNCPRRCHYSSLLARCECGASIKLAEGPAAVTVAGRLADLHVRPNPDQLDRKGRGTGGKTYRTQGRDLNAAGYILSYSKQQQEDPCLGSQQDPLYEDPRAQPHHVLSTTRYSRNVTWLDLTIWSEQPQQQGIVTVTVI